MNKEYWNKKEKGHSYRDYLRRIRDYFYLVGGHVYVVREDGIGGSCSVNDLPNYVVGEGPGMLISVG